MWTSSLHVTPSEIFNLGQSVAVFVQAKNGYGMPSAILSLSSQSSVLKVCATSRVNNAPGLTGSSLNMQLRCCTF